MNAALLRGLLLLGSCVLARAEVTRVVITQRSEVGSSGYEKIVGKLHFAIDPGAAPNRVIADLDRAPVNAAGRVEFSADLYLLRPTAPAAGNGAALLEVSNRGGRSLVTSFNRGGSRDPEKDADLGDGFLMREGFTLAWVGWEFDVPPTPGLMRIEVPVATERGQPLTTVLRLRFRVDARAGEHTLTDLAAHTPADPGGADTELAELTADPAGPAPSRKIVPRAQWTLRGQVVTLAGGFTPGATYELSYRAANPPIAGLGFAALRDTTAWLKHAPDAAAPVRHVYAFGSSQSGRLLRDFLYHGFNTDERGRAVFDGVIAHIAGAARINFNRRWSVPRELGMYAVSSFPFSDRAQPDPISGAREGLLENPRVRHAPKIFYTNTSVEYWGGGRVAALVHTDPAGTRDVPLPDHVRFYAFAGTQHGPARFPPAAATTASARANPADFWWTMRALVPALHRWVSAGVAPPASRYPTFHDATLVRAADVRLPAVPGLASPRRLDAGGRVANPLLPAVTAGPPLPLLVPEVDEDGNERAGIRLPEIAVPLATHTGWNFRAPAAGAPGELVSLIGSWIPFPATPAERERTGDPRRSIAERYPSRADFLARHRAAAEELAREGYLLRQDLPLLLQRAEARWDYLAGGNTAR